MQESLNAFTRLYEIVKRLRAPDGCPWDREQSPESLRGDLIEETYECIEAIDEKDEKHIREELGDLFLLVTMLSYMHEEKASFSVADVLDGVSDKLIRRHPHVFGDVQAKDSVEVLKQWARIKVEQEGRAPKDSVMDEVSSSLPPLDKAYKLQKKAAKRGFDWPDISGALKKVEEELTEVKDIIFSGQLDEKRGELEMELGDLLFSVVNVCRFFKIEGSLALNRTNAKFIKRFKYVEQKMKEANEEMNQENLELMDKYWDEIRYQD